MGFNSVFKGLMLPEDGAESPKHLGAFLMQFNILIYTSAGTAVAQLLRCCARNGKVAGSFPDGVIGIFHWHNPSDRTVALGPNQPVTEMSTRSASWGVKTARA